MLSQLLDAIADDITQVTGDGACYTKDCDDTIDHREATITLPPRPNAKIWQHGNCKSPPHPRGENLRQHQMRRRRWKRERDYHRCLLSETAMFWLNTIFSCKLCRPNFDNQAMKLFLQCAAFNQMIQ